MLIIQRAQSADISKIADLEKEIFSDAWSEKSLLETWNQKNAEIFIAKNTQKGMQEEKKDTYQIAGYVIFYYVLDEGEIARIAVSPAFRRCGTATQIFRKLQEFCGEKEIKKIMLEVRESNEAARAFYKKCGFEEDGIRKNYYEDPKENAVLMSVINNGNSYNTFH